MALCLAAGVLRAAWAVGCVGRSKICGDGGERGKGINRARRNEEDEGGSCLGRGPLTCFAGLRTGVNGVLAARRRDEEIKDEG